MPGQTGPIIPVITILIISAATDEQGPLSILNIPLRGSYQVSDEGFQPPERLMEARVERAERDLQANQKAPAVTSCIMWERPNEGNLRILKFKTSRKIQHCEPVKPHLLAGAGPRSGVRALEILPVNQPSCFLLWTRGALRQIGLTKEKHTAARNTEDQILTGLWAAGNFNKTKLKPVLLKETNTESSYCGKIHLTQNLTF